MEQTAIPARPVDAAFDRGFRSGSLIGSTVWTEIEQLAHESLDRHAGSIVADNATDYLRDWLDGYLEAISHGSPPDRDGGYLTVLSANSHIGHRRYIAIVRRDTLDELGLRWCAYRLKPQDCGTPYLRNDHPSYLVQFLAEQS